MSEADRDRWNDKHAAAPAHEPEPFVVSALARLRPWPPGVPRTALDVACGTGRHAMLLAREGFDVLAVDASDVAVARTAASAAAAGANVRAVRRDLDAGLPTGRFGLVLCTHFLDRALWRALRDAVEPGGGLIVQTFTAAESERSGFPLRFCLQDGELLRELRGFDVLEHAVIDDGRILEGAVARRPRHAGWADAGATPPPSGRTG